MTTPKTPKATATKTATAKAPAVKATAARMAADAKAAAKPAKAKAPAAKVAAKPAAKAADKKVTATIAASSKAKMLGLTAKAISAAQDGADISEVTSQIPGMSAVVKAAKKQAKASGATLKIAKVKVERAIVPRNKGPRGFRVDSPAWLKSITDGKGIALVPANLPKLMDTAEVKGAAVSADMTQAEIVQAIAKVMTAA